MNLLKEDGRPVFFKPSNRGTKSNPKSSVADIRRQAYSSHIYLPMLWV